MITDRTKEAAASGHAYDCFLVTGSIGPDFPVRLFKYQKDALAYAREIDRTPAFPAFGPVIEPRTSRDMLGRLKLE